VRILVLDSALARCIAAVVIDDAVMAERAENRRQGHEAALPVMVSAVLNEAGRAIDLVAVTVGPGSFTGIRAGLALAHGVALASGVPAVGVTVGEAIADAFPHLGERALWTVTDSRRDHIFLERGEAVVSLALDTLPMPDGKVAIAGGAAMQVAAWLAARGANVMLTDARFPLARHIALVAGGGPPPPPSPAPPHPR
jgi:tRNA threonylcarbamoyladenosine biosynthesis protein TsaB